MVLSSLRLTSGKDLGHCLGVFLCYPVDPRQFPLVVRNQGFGTGLWLVFGTTGYQLTRGLSGCPGLRRAMFATPERHEPSAPEARGGAPSLSGAAPTDNDRNLCKPNEVCSD